MKKSKFHSCNVLDVNVSSREIWKFHTGNSQVKLESRQSLDAGQPLPARFVEKTWRDLWQPKLNIAWLPADQLFLRVIQLPKTDFAETLSMVEFQLEKLSPLPVNQIVWSLEVLAGADENTQTVVVLIADRDVVEAYLGTLEGENYLADRLELPCFHQLLASQETPDGIWIYPMDLGGKLICMVAWWGGKMLRQLQLLHLENTGQRVSALVEQLTKTAWAGEMEGWIQNSQPCFLVTEKALASEWETALQQWSGLPVTVCEPMSKEALAEISARRASRNEAKANLMPAEYRVRYHQQFIDRLWMSGLAGVVAAYLVGVLIYFGALQVVKYQKTSVEREVAGLSTQYTNAIKLEERIGVLEDQLLLKFAALDCLRVASEYLPLDLTLERLVFARGQRLTLDGTASLGQDTQLTDYNEALRRAMVNGQPLFSKVERPNWDQRGQSISWRFQCELNRAEIE